MKNFLFVLTAAFLLCGCASYDDATLHMNESVLSGSCARGNVVVVSLASNPTTGYSWRLENPENGGLKFVSQKYESENTGLAGAGGREEFVFIAEKSGVHSVEFSYVRPWENGEPAKKITFNVSVK